MTQQIINVGTGPDSYTGESLRTAFQKTNDNFSQLYAGNVGANISGNIITANGFVTSGNVVAGNVTAAGNISAYYFIGDGSQLTGVTVSANTGNISFSNLIISGSVAGNIVLDPAGDGNVNILSTMRTQAVRVGNVNNTEFAIDVSGNTATISTAGRGNGNVSLQLVANNNSKGSITIRADDGHMGFGIPPDGYEYAFNGEVRANAYYADADFPVGYQFTTPGGDTGMTHDYQNDSNGNVSLVIIKHDSVAAAKFYDNNHTILSGNLVVSQTGNVFGAAYPDAFMQAYANVNSYSQTIIQNLNSGNLASSDVVATADNGNDNSHYINMGIASSTYNVAGFDVVGPNDGYLYVAGNSYAGPFSNTANLNIGSTTGSVRTWIGQGTAANVVTTVSPGSFTVNGTISTTGNIIPGANVTYNLGSSTRQWKDLWLSNSTMYLGGFPVTVSNTGVLSVNGSPVTGNVTFNNQAVVGTGDQQGASGLYLAPGTQSVGNLQYLRVRGGDVPTHIHLDTGNNTYFDQYFGDDFKYIKLVNTGNIVINTNNLVDASAQWTFGTTGTLTLPGATAGETIATSGGYITVGNLLIGQGGSLFNSNNDSWALYGNISDPGATILIPSNADADNGTPLYIESQQSNVEIRSGSSTWRFGTDGNIILPNGAVIKDNAGDSVAFGQSAGATSQGNSAVAIGHNAGVTSQGTFTVAIGRNAGQTSQGGSAVAVGVSAGDVSQGAQAVAVGNGAGGGNQGNSAVAIGVGAGQSTQGVEAVAIGNSAGSLTQGISAIAIGKGAGRYFQGNNSIIINATGADLDQTTANTFTVAPVRNDVANIGEVLFYNTTSKEITYGNTISVAGNITGGNLITTVLLVSGGITAGPIIASPAPTISGFSSISAQTLTASGNVIVGNTYVPSTAAGAGTAGQISFDGNYVYVCVAANTWKRANLSTW